MTKIRYIRYMIENPHYREDYYNEWVNKENNKMIKGVVQKINRKPWGDKTLTSFFIKGQDGMFSLGDKPATFNEGDSIQFDVQQQGKYLYAKDISPWEDGGIATAPRVESVANAKPYRQGRPKFGGKSEEEKDYWNNRNAKEEVTQRRIEVQAARNAAIQTASFMWEKGLIKTPTKQADQYDAFLALVNQIADEFLNNTAARLGTQISIDAREAGENSTEVAEGDSDQGEWD